MTDDPHAQMYETSIKSLGTDGRQHTGDFRLFRAATAGEAASYAARLNRRLYGTREPIIEVRTCCTDDAPESYDLFTPARLTEEGWTQ